MTDDAEFDDALEPIEIDVRSPGEKWGDSGRAGFDRLQASVKAQPLGTMAVCWLSALIVYLAAAAYTEVDLQLGHAFPGEGIWLKLATLGQTVDFAVSVAALIGIALALLSGSSLARLAYRLALVVGSWTVLVSAGAVIAAIHGYDISLNPFAQTRWVQVVLALTFGASGFIVAMLAWRLAAAENASRVRRPGGDAPEIAEIS